MSPIAPHAPGGELEGREDWHLPPEPAEAPPFCDRCFGYHAWNAGCPEDDCDDEGDVGYPPPCTSPGGHSYVVSDDERRCYCEYCGADGDA